jgi:hypothetical protein
VEVRGQGLSEGDKGKETRWDRFVTVHASGPSIESDSLRGSIGFLRFMHRSIVCLLHFIPCLMIRETRKPQSGVRCVRI